MVRTDSLVSYLSQSDKANDNEFRAPRHMQVVACNTALEECIPYGYDLVGANTVPADSTWNRKVCVIDTGYDISHGDLPTDNVTGTSFYGQQWSVDGKSHGTHVAGTIAATANNGKGIKGVAPGVKLHIAKGLRDDGKGESYIIIEAVSMFQL